MDRELFCSLALLGIEGIGPRRFAALIQRFKTAENAYNATRSELGSFWAGTRGALAGRIVDARKNAGVTLRIVQTLEKAAQKGVSGIPLASARYPRWLRTIEDPPPILWGIGEIAVDELCIAIVGTRKACRYGLKAAAVLAVQIACAGATVVSGMALGIDSSAQRALTDKGHRTIAVLGSGPDLAFSGGRATLAEAIIENRGALVSEYPPGTRALPHHFPARNRIISGLCRAVVVVEAPKRSGALITARFASEQGREVLAVPGSILTESFEGCHSLIRDGAGIATSAYDVFRQISVFEEPKDALCGTALSCVSHEAQMYALFDRGQMRFEDMVAQSEQDVGVVGVCIKSLLRRGLIREVEPGVYERL